MKIEIFKKKKRLTYCKNNEYFFVTILMVYKYFNVDNILKRLFIVKKVF